MQLSCVWFQSRVIWSFDFVFLFYIKIFISFFFFNTTRFQKVLLPCHFKSLKWTTNYVRRKKTFNARSSSRHDLSYGDWNSEKIISPKVDTNSALLFRRVLWPSCFFFFFFCWSTLLMMMMSFRHSRPPLLKPLCTLWIMEQLHWDFLTAAVVTLLGLHLLSASL